jgi:muramoyltetrapeptide carboxypeptidase
VLNQKRIYAISPSSAVGNADGLDTAIANLDGLGFDVELDRAALSKHQRFAGSDAVRARAFERAAANSAEIVMTTRGGYGLTRLLNRLDFDALAQAEKHWVGLSDFTAFHLAMLAKAGAGTWAGPALLEDFAADDIDETTAAVFCDAMEGSLHGLGFECDAPAGIAETGVLWGGNLSLVCSLLGSEFFPRVDGGLLFLEEVGEHPYRVERMLTQLLHAGVIDRQAVVIFGYVNRYKPVPNDNGFDWNAVVKWLQTQTRTPVVTGLPFGHGHPKLTLPHGAQLGFQTDRREAFFEFPTHQH